MVSKIWVRNGIEYEWKIAVRHPLIDQVKASPNKLVVNEERRVVHICYNTPVNMKAEGFEDKKV